MEGPALSSSFDRLKSRVSQFDVSGGKTLLIPDMAPFGSRLLAASFRAFEVPAVVMKTYEGLALGKEYTSGKECFPCQVTLGDILHHLEEEKKRLGAAFSPDNYIYFLPEANGPCRFGMYNKMQRLILDRFEDFQDVSIVYLSTENGYSTGSILPPQKAGRFRKLAYVTAIVADVMDRTVWRVRPYEVRRGLTDEFMSRALETMMSTIEKVGGDLKFNTLYGLLEDIVATCRTFMDEGRPRRPRIGIVGEIYLRSHPASNQNLVEELEKYGAEVVDASIGEWINYISYDQARNSRRHWIRALSRGRLKDLKAISGRLMAQELEKLYQSWRQGQVYRRALKHLDIQPDHSIGLVEKRLDRDRLFNFDIGTEAALSIGGALEYAHEGFDGIVNVFPFTCMPSTICSSILKPILHTMKIPYLDSPYDGAIQPNREAALRTFIYQARQHLELRLKGKGNGKGNP